MKNFLFILFGVFVVAGAFAAGENVPTSKSYVDSKLAEKQDNIIANDTPKVLTNTGTAGEYGTKGIYDANGAYAVQTQNLVDAATMNAGVQNAIDSEFQCIEWLDPNDHSSDCLLFNIFGETERSSPNLFDVSKIPTRLSSPGTQIVNNGDGSITVTEWTNNSAITTGRPLSTLAPELVAGKTYTLSFDTTGDKTTYFHCYGHTGDNFYWRQNTAKTITNEMLGCYMYFYASRVSTTATIKNIQITEGTDVKPYVAYGNIYMPVGQ